MSIHHDRDPPETPGEDAAVTRTWRLASDEQPPVQLDSAILAAAHRSVQEDEGGTEIVAIPARARPRWMQWQPLAAAAAVAGLAFVLVQTRPDGREVAPHSRMAAPAAPAAPATPERRGVPTERVDAPAAAPEPDVAQEMVGTAPAQAFTQAPAPADAGAPLPARSAESAAGVEGYRSPALRVAPAEATPGAGDWIVRIEALHESGDLDGAAALLREFRAIDPGADARLPQSLREWAQSVR